MGGSAGVEGDGHRFDGEQRGDVAGNGLAAREDRLDAPRASTPAVVASAILSTARCMSTFTKSTGAPSCTTSTSR